MVERFFTTTRSLLNQSVNFPFCACVLTTTKRLRLWLRTIPIGARFVTSTHFPLYTLEYATLVNIDEDGNNEDDNDEEMAEKGVEKEKDWMIAMVFFPARPRMQLPPRDWSLLMVGQTSVFRPTYTYSRIRHHCDIPSVPDPKFVPGRERERTKSVELTCSTSSLNQRNSEDHGNTIHFYYNGA